MIQKRIKISVVITMLLVSGCASVSISNFQDGKSLGKGTIRVGTGIEMSPMMNYGLGGADKENPESNLKQTGVIKENNPSPPTLKTLFTNLLFLAV